MAEQREYTVSIRADATDLRATFKSATGLFGEFRAGFKEGVADSLEKGGKAADQFGDSVKKAASSSLSSFESIALKIGGVVGALDLAGKAMSAIGGAIEGVFAGISRGGELDDLSKKIGVSEARLCFLRAGSRLDPCCGRVAGCRYPAPRATPPPCAHRVRERTASRPGAVRKTALELPKVADGANKAADAIEKLRERFDEQIRTQTEAIPPPYRQYQSIATLGMLFIPFWKSESGPKSFSSAAICGAQRLRDGLLKSGVLRLGLGRLDRIEASNAKIEERIDLWREAFESVHETLSVAANRIQQLPHELGQAVAKQLSKLLRPKR